MLKAVLLQTLTGYLSAYELEVCATINHTVALALVGQADITCNNHTMITVRKLLKHLPVTFCCGDLRFSDDLLPVAMFLRDVLAFLSLSTMNFLVRGCPSGVSSCNSGGPSADSNCNDWPSGDDDWPRLTATLLPFSNCLWRGDLLNSGVLAFGDLLVTFGDRLLTFGDLRVMSGDPWPTCDALVGEKSHESAAILNVDVSFTVRRGLRSGHCSDALLVDRVSGDSAPWRLTTSDAGLTADDGWRLPTLDLGLLLTLSNCLPDASRRRRRLVLLAGEGLWSVNFSRCLLAAESVNVLSGVAL